MEKFLKQAAWVSLTLLLASCTAIVGSKLEKPRDVGGEAEAEIEIELDIVPDEEATADEEDLAEEDAVEDAPADVGPDFDPDTCGVWGTVSIPDHAAVGINGSDDRRDGNGPMQIMVLYPDTFIVDFLNLKTFPEYAYLDFTLDGPNYYCIPEAFFTDSGIEDAWIMPFVLDGPTSEPDEPNDFLTFQGIIPDPLTIMIAASTYKDADAVDRNKSRLYWTDAAPDNSLAIDLSRRASKFNGKIQFSGFLASPLPRNARVCITVFGERDPSWERAGEFPTELLGYNFIDLEDTDVEELGSLDFSVDFAASPGQAFKVHLKYIENRSRSSFFAQCGDTEILASCDSQCYSLGDTVGVPFAAGADFAIDMLGGVTDPSCEVDMANVCP
jgi:hypothetical protein